MHGRAEKVAIIVPLCTDDALEDLVEPWLSDVARGDASSPMSPRGPCLNLVVCGLSPSLPGSIALGDMVPAPKSLSAVDLGVMELWLPGYPSAPSPPISWRQVENITEQACSQVAAADRLLRKAMAMVGHDFLDPI
jgi:hypothetical protein